MAAKRYVLAIDQGTTRTKAALFDVHGQVCGFGSAEVKRMFPRPAWVEEKPDQIWRSLLLSVRTAMRRARCSAKQIVGVGLDNQGETVIAWNKKSGNPVYNAIVWQCRRTDETCLRLKTRPGLARMIRQKTGLVIDPYFSATKMRWIIDNVEHAKRLAKLDELVLGTSDTWLIRKMAVRTHPITDFATASRTLLFNIHKMKWDEDLLRIFKIPEESLPDIIPNSGELAHTDPQSFLGIDAPISGLIVDQQAALFGHGCFKQGEMKNTYGTGCFMLMNTGRTPKLSNHGLLTTVAWVVNGVRNYALDGGVYTAGSAIDWLVKGLGIIRNPRESDKLASGLQNNEGVFFVPAFVGLAAPFWDSTARGLIVGITDGTNSAGIVRATLESIAYQVDEVRHCMEADSGLLVRKLMVDGGPTANRFLMQFQANVSGVPVEVPRISEVTVSGTAFLAGLGVNFWDNVSELIRAQKHEVYRPKMRSSERTRLLVSWKRAVARSRGWGGE